MLSDTKLPLQMRWNDRSDPKACTAVQGTLRRLHALPRLRRRFPRVAFTQTISIVAINLEQDFTASASETIQIFNVTAVYGVAKKLLYSPALNAPFAAKRKQHKPVPRGTGRIDGEDTPLKNFVFGMVAIILVTIAVIYVVVRSGAIPANADGRPLLFENWAARTSLKATLARDAPKEPNPIPLTAENLIAGIKLYGEHCAICHGNANGNSSASPVAKGLYPKPPQLASDGVEDDPEGYTFWKIQHGIRWTGMPSWKSKLSDAQTWTLALFLKHMDHLPPAAQTAWQQVKN